jgi:FkbH-like protein
MDLTKIKNLLAQSDPDFWPELASLTQQALGFEQLFSLLSLRKKAKARGLRHPTPDSKLLRLAILGGYSLYPLHDLLTHLLEAEGTPSELFLGDYDNYVAEITDPGGRLSEFRPAVVCLLPAAQRCRYLGKPTDAREKVQSAASAVVTELLDLCRTVHERAGAEVILGNFNLPARHDLGAYRSRTLASDWNFRKSVNLELGLSAPSFVHICDLEFLANRHGALAAEDARGWFESKQLCAPDMLVEVCRELSRLILALRRPPKKVLVLDLDNTLWGGTVAEDGLEGIEIGDTSPRGEAFKAFQKYIRSLKDRGVLLAVCSKNDLALAQEVFEQHPEMILRPSDFVAFKANWEPKSDNLRQIAVDLNLGLDSLVFVDDNPAELEIVRQFAPGVTTILLSPDPAEYVGQLQDCRMFEPHNITPEDVERTGQYRAETQRQTLLASATDMDAYLASLAMEASITEFVSVDVPRLAQLINKSNQFNLTTRRRTEAEVQSLLSQPDHICFSLRLKDRFGDHGLVSIVIGRLQGDALEIDTWLMSCRVLKRQVEETVLNELARLAHSKGCIRLQGLYLATAKNEMVRDFYPRMGFQTKAATAERGEFTLELNGFQPKSTKITVIHHAYEPN